MSAEFEKQCLRRSLRRTAWVLGTLVVLVVGAAIVAAIMT
jgi:hypothetical protein